MSEAQPAGESQQDDRAAVARVSEMMQAAMRDTPSDQQQQEQPKPVEQADDEGANDPDESQRIVDEALADPQPGDGPAKPGSLKELAENAGLTLDELYQLKVPMGDGRDAVALGGLKDQLTEAVNLDATRSEAFEAERVEFENEMIRGRQELQQIVAQLPELPPGLLDSAKQAHIELIDRERAALLTVKPEWSDPETYRAARVEILGAVAEYGFGESDLGMVVDHRLTKLLHDFARLKQRVATANSRMKEVREGGQPKRARGASTVKRGGKAADGLIEKARTGDDRDKQNAVAAVILQGIK